jgi:hypothetical protein
LVSGSHGVVRWFRNTAQQLPRLVLLSSARGTRLGGFGVAWVGPRSACFALSGDGTRSGWRRSRRGSFIKDAGNEVIPTRANNEFPMTQVHFPLCSSASKSSSTLIKQLTPPVIATTSSWRETSTSPKSASCGHSCILQERGTRERTSCSGTRSARRKGYRLRLRTARR